MQNSNEENTETQENATASNSEVASTAEPLRRLTPEQRERAERTMAANLAHIIEAIDQGNKEA